MKAIDLKTQLYHTSEVLCDHSCHNMDGKDDDDDIKVNLSLCFN
jgi:hypothetical protein